MTSRESWNKSDNYRMSWVRVVETGGSISDKKAEVETERGYHAECSIIRTSFPTHLDSMADYEQKPGSPQFVLTCKFMKLAGNVRIMEAQVRRSLESAVRVACASISYDVIDRKWAGPGRMVPYNRYTDGAPSTTSPTGRSQKQSVYTLKSFAR